MKLDCRLGIKHSSYLAILFPRLGGFAQARIQMRVYVFLPTQRYALRHHSPTARPQTVTVAAKVAQKRNEASMSLSVRANEPACAFSFGHRSAVSVQAPSNFCFGARVSWVRRRSNPCSHALTLFSLDSTSSSKTM